MSRDPKEQHRTGLMGFFRRHERLTWALFTCSMGLFFITLGAHSMVAGLPIYESLFGQPMFVLAIALGFGFVAIGLFPPARLFEREEVKRRQSGYAARKRKAREAADELRQSDRW